MRGPTHSIVRPMVDASSRQRAIAHATSSTQTGWKRAAAPASGTTGKSDCSEANRFRKRSRSPKITDGRSTVRSSPAPRSTASPRAFERRYLLGASAAAPSALTWMTRRTPATRHASASRCGNCTWTRSNSAWLPCSTATRLITASVSRSIQASVSSSCTSPAAISTVGSNCRWRARVRWRVRDADPPVRAARALDQLFADAAADEAGGAEHEDPFAVTGRSFSGGGAFGSGGPIVRPSRARTEVVAAAQQGRVVAAVGEHLLDVVARLGERDVLDPDGGVEHGPFAPLARPARAGVVGRRGHRLRAADVVEHQLQVGVAEAQVGVAVGDQRGRVGQADLLRRPPRGRRHQLHQPGRADARARVEDEARLLADQAVDERRVEADLAARARRRRGAAASGSAAPCRSRRASCRWC